MTEMTLDRGPVARRPVGDDDLDLVAPAMPLGRQKRNHGTEVPVLDHSQQLASLGIGDDRHVTVTAS